MGFLSDLMKNPFVQMALPFALSYVMPGIGSMIGTSAIANPMMRSAAEQAMLGYGTAALTGSKHPEKAAMYAGLGSMPFSFMKAQGAANLYNKELGTLQGQDPSIFHTKQLSPFKEAIPGKTDYLLEEGMFRPRHATTFGQPEVSSTWGMSDAGTKFLEQDKLTPWDILKGSEKMAEKMAPVPTMRDTNFIDSLGRSRWGAFKDADISKATYDYNIPTPEVDFYSKLGKDQKNLLGQTLTKGETFTDWTPTIASQTAGWYGGRPTEEEEWEDAKKRRRKELAFMYGIDESLMGGELQNPYYTGGGFWKDGGIAALQMDNGGAVDGPGGPKDDVIDAKLSDGEFVMTAKAVENLGGGNRLAGAKQMYNMMNQLDPQSETVGESVIGV
jgi:hypothetical protein